MNTTTFDPAKLDELLGKFVLDLGAALHASTIVVGDRLGLYAALASEATTAEELARKTSLSGPMVREWLSAQAASGYVQYDPHTGRYHMTPEQRYAFADPDGVSMPGAFLVARSTMVDVERIEAAFRNGKGVGWHEHHHDLFHGTERFFRPGYVANLVSSWIPALEDVQEKLAAGARVADVGCGHGASTIVMARAFPRSRFHGFDYHEESIRHARKIAERAGVAERVTFEVAGAKAYPGDGYDLVTFFDCLHDMGDPVGAATHVRESLSPTGTWMIVEPLAGDRVSDNLNPVGRIYYSASTMICTPASQAQEVGAALGAQAGEAKLREVIGAGGFTRIRRAAETPFNMVLEARR